MPAPLGNQYAVGNQGGRPSKYNVEQIAIALIEWSQKDDSINLNKFCFSHDPKIPPPKISEWANSNEVFKEAYEIAKSALGYRREEWLNMNSLHVKAYDLNASVYDFFLKQEKRAQAEFESALKKEEVAQVSDDIKVMGERISSTIREGQEALKRDRNRKSNEDKSA